MSKDTQGRIRRQSLNDSLKPMSLDRFPWFLRRNPTHPLPSLIRQVRPVQFV